MSYNDFHRSDSDRPHYSQDSETDPDLLARTARMNEEHAREDIRTGVFDVEPEFFGEQMWQSRAPIKDLATGIDPPTNH
jgi:hypothetical protein